MKTTDIRGLAIIPGEQNNRLIGFDLEDEKSKFVLYFNNPESGNANSPADDSLPSDSDLQSEHLPRRLALC